MSEGEGDEELQRWYFNIKRRFCSPFVYRGLKGNENNFVTKRLCERACESESLSCSDGIEPLRINGRIMRCTNVSCPETHYCHVGDNQQSTVCCKRQG
ncbi:unnamed protein product [Gongylonema pulchrum]|uniref:BPTI/Kunitz inhibitor domain-containing protein n=1 Tax=Gongylonema pulchrum TaxID=637853 RepID=A0A183ECM6_9BILA|nr:unnamed protein product [Gongylonema pulchrum]